ncbi:MAG TPA: hypothetical protein PLG99_10455 [Kaistiaceae bacterium]|nr:hypothetical protein [Kaistiaceae bacterium]
MSIVLRVFSGLVLGCILLCVYAGYEVLLGVSFKGLIGIFLVSLLVTASVRSADDDNSPFGHWTD